MKTLEHHERTEYRIDKDGDIEIDYVPDCIWLTKQDLGEMLKIIEDWEDSQ